MKLKNIAQHIHAETQDVIDQEVSGVSIDSRVTRPDELFFALPGEHVDGHSYVAKAIEHGAAGAVVSQWQAIDAPQLKVKDTTVALAQLSRVWREQFHLPVVAITGSQGKTTTKNILASICRAASSENEVLASRKSFNNHLGVPLTLCQLNSRHRYGVFEIGMNHSGEIERLVALVKPDIAVITMISSTHIGQFASLDEIAQAKAEIFSGLSDDGVAVINRDDQYYETFCNIARPKRIVSFGQSHEANIHLVSFDRQHIVIQTPKGKIDTTLPLLGRHNIVNALAAVAAAFSLEIPLLAIEEGLAHVMPEYGRCEPKSFAKDVLLIDDSYNASPISVSAAIDILAEYPGRKIMVFGGMGELGDKAEVFHREVAYQLSQKGVSHLMTYGDMPRATFNAFEGNKSHYDTHDALADALSSLLQPNDTVLIKGSRSARMEKVIDMIRSS
ncbi:MAG: UDP-N-acetylmuramoyl-tripeptide--D-alanyl-D-alanine ligase [Gammaproteobacteria bacterium]